MRLDCITGTQASPALFPDYNAALQTAMVRDMRGTWESIAFDDCTSALDLFTSTKVVVNSDLAKLYGLDATGLTSTTFQTRALPADGPRLGILGKPGFLSEFANQKEGSPTLRGRFIREALLCMPIPSPPGDIDIVLEDPPPTCRRPSASGWKTIGPRPGARAVTNTWTRSACRSDLRRDWPLPDDRSRSAHRPERRFQWASRSPTRAASARPPA